jgi:hypothetical protein
MSDSQLKKDNIVVFYHVYQAEGWQHLFQQQIYSLISSGLYEKLNSLYICVNGSQPLPFELNKFQIYYNNDTTSEKDTLVKLWQYCRFVTNAKILYFHTKSVSYYWHAPTKTNVDAWRIYMEHYLIYNWKNCVSLLDSYDCVGTEYNDPENCVWVGENEQCFNLSKIRCFSGNFWWVNAEYFKQLDINFLDKLNVSNLNLISSDISCNNCIKLKRFNSERLLFENSPKFFNIKNINTNNNPQFFYTNNCFNEFIKDLVKEKNVNKSLSYK